MEKEIIRIYKEYKKEPCCPECENKALDLFYNDILEAIKEQSEEEFKFFKEVKRIVNLEHYLKSLEQPEEKEDKNCHNCLHFNPKKESQICYDCYYWKNHKYK